LNCRKQTWEGRALVQSDDASRGILFVQLRGARFVRDDNYRLSFQHQQIRHLWKVRENLRNAVSY
jgi:hypothetical protein